MRVVLDTNIFLVSIPPQSTQHLIFQKLLEKEYELLVSSDILLEYEEILAQRANPIIAKHAFLVLENLPNVIKVENHFRWNLIEVDKDDNKFVDAAFNGNADYLVSNDRHFNILKSTDFPKVTLLNLEEFMALLMK